MNKTYGSKTKQNLVAKLNYECPQGRESESLTTGQFCCFLHFLKPLLVCSGILGGGFSSRGGMSRTKAAATEACSSESRVEAGNERSVVSSASLTSLADSELESGELSSVSEAAEAGSSSGSDLILGEEAHWRFLAGGLVEELCFSIEVSISLATAASSQRADP